MFLTDRAVVRATEVIADGSKPISKMRREEEHAKSLLARFLGIAESSFAPGDDPPDYVLTTKDGARIAVEITTGEAVTEKDGATLPRRNVDEPIFRLVKELDAKYASRMDVTDSLFLWLLSSAQAYREIPQLAEQAVQRFLADPSNMGATIYAQSGEEVGEIWRDHRKKGSRRGINGVPFNENTPSLVSVQTDFIIASPLVTKERKLKNWPGEKWLVIYSFYPLDEPGGYAQSAMRFAHSHTFAKVFLIIDNVIHLIFERKAEGREPVS